MSPKKSPWRSFVSSIIIILAMQFCNCSSNIYAPATSKAECSALRGLLNKLAAHNINGSELITTNCNCTQEINSNSTAPPLMTWIPYDKQCINCSAAQYPRVRCTGSVVTELSMSNVAGMPKEILSFIAASFHNLKHLDLSSNNISGSIPSSFWALQKLTHLNLSSNKLINFTNHPSIPTNHSLIPTNHPLKILDLANNRLRFPFAPNSIAIDLCNWLPNLTTLILSSNNMRSDPNYSFNLSLCDQLEHLDVSSNKLRGHFGSFNYKFPPNLSKLNVSHNSLVVGFTSAVIFRYGLSSFWPNKACRACFKLSDDHAMTSASPSPSPSLAALVGHSHAPLLKAKAAKIAGIATGGTALMLLISTVICVVMVVKRRRRKKLWPPSKAAPTPPFKHNLSTEIGPFSFESHSGTWVADVKDPSNVPVVIFHKPLLNLTFADLIEATGSFNRDSEVGDGTGLVYTCMLPGVLDDRGAKVAIKVVEDGNCLSMKEAEAAFREMGEMVNHLNLVPLLGYCVVGEEKLLIYKHMEEGSLEDFLHHAAAGRPEATSRVSIAVLPEAASPLSKTEEDWHNIETWEVTPQSAASTATLKKLDMVDWEVRLKIGLGVARSIAYLHYGCRRPIIHGAVSSSCILLDVGLVAKLANYGGGWGLSRRMTIGYVAPECAHQTSTAGTKVMAITAKCDVYSMGVVLLELATGLRPIGDYHGVTTLVAWVHNVMRENKGGCAIDPQLPTIAHSQVLEVLKMGYLCTAYSASKRPSIQQVVGLLKDLVSLN